MKITFTYEDHEPSSYTLDQNQDAAPILSCGESLRIWTNNIRDFRISNNGGHDLVFDSSGAGSFIRSGEELDAELFAGLIDSNGQIELYIEAVDVVAQSPITVEVDIKNIGKIEDTVYVSTIKTGFAVDANRDETIDFNSLEDCLIKTINPDGTNNVDPVYNFWVNNDIDYGHNDLDYGYIEEDRESGTADFDDPGISVKRDLDDFSRIQIKSKIADNIDKSKFSYKITADNNAIHLFKTYDKDITRDYQTKREYVDDSWVYVADNYVGNAVPVNLNIAIPHDDGNNGYFNSDGIAPFIFEGGVEGCFNVTLEVRYENLPIASRSLTINLCDISDFYFNLAENKNECIIFVHGWRLDRHGKKFFADTMVKMLWWEGYTGTTVAYKWLCSVGLLDFRTFNESELTAWECGADFADKVSQFRPYHDNVSVLAHSQGNVVAGEALRLLPANTINNYVASNAALSTDYYSVNNQNVYITTPSTPNVIGYYSGGNSGNPYFSDVYNKGTALFNYFLPDDKALFWWRVNNSTAKPDLWWGYRYKDNYGTVADYNEVQNDKFMSHAGLNRLTFANNDTFEIFARCAQSRTKAMGVAVCPDYEGRNLDFPGLKYDVVHSKPFVSWSSDSRPYWQLLMSDCGLSDLTP